MSKDSTSSESQSDSDNSAKSIDTDPLNTNHTNNSNDSKEIPISDNDVVHMESDNNNTEKSQDSVNSNEEGSSNNIGKIKFVPLNRLMKNDTKKTNKNSIEISSGSSSDEPLSSLHKSSKKRSPKKRFSKTQKSRSAYVEISSEESNKVTDSDQSDSDDTIIIKSRKPKTTLKSPTTQLSDSSSESPNLQSLGTPSKSPTEQLLETSSKSPTLQSLETSSKSITKQLPDNIYSVKVNLSKLPSDLNSVLAEHNIVKICDQHHNVIASRDKSHQNEKKTKRTNSNRLLSSDGNSSQSSDDNELLVKLRTTQKRNDNDAPDTLKRKSKPNKRSKRTILSSDTDSDNDSIDDKKKMRKKNIPKSSTDVTDSADGSNSEDEIEESSEKSSESEDEIPVKRKRYAPVKKSSDEDYPEPKKQQKRRKRIKKNSDSSDADGDDNSPKKHGRKNIRKMIRSSDLEVETKEAAKREMERKKRIEERQKLYNEMYDNKLEEITELEKLVLDFDPETKEELISVDKKLVKKLKPHQAQGIKFMWDACFESIEKLNENNGGGCILAHCMGLGKTLQVVALVHTLLTHSEQTNVEKVLIICPVSTVLNWVNEFKIWLRQCGHNRNIEIHEISKYKQNAERAYRINEWHKEGGVLILGYDMFRNLSSENNRIRKKQRDIFQESLVDPGADLVVCDEGHLLKNAKTSLSKAVNRIRTMRRIVLTGTPLQNNLNEYYCMVQFVKPNLLGKYNEYLNRFVNPITNGQYTDSTPYDIQMMKRRSHILHKLLDGCVQRRDYSVLAPFLPPKQEYVLYIRLTKLQVDLYKYYMANRPAQNEFGKTRSSILFQDFQNLQRIWTHPRVLRYNSDRYEQMVAKKKFLASDDEEGSLKDFIDDDDDSDSNTSSDSSASSSNSSSVQSVHSDKPSNSKKQPQARRTRATAKDFDPEPIEPIKEENPTEWWMPLCPEEELNNTEQSGKLMLLFSILADCEACGDKLLVFSQSLFSLDVIEHFLAMIDENTQNPNPDAKLGGFTGNWARGVDYFRLDGSTNIETRNANCINFNSDENSQARLFLISTRAGGLGINLVAANRVIIFDASWNPSHDIQSIFRIYRFGQKKPCYIYRFIALGTMEEKIYERQVTKLAISKRVIDEHQIDRHYKENDLNELYNIENIDPEEERPQPKLPKDRMFAEQLQKYPNHIYKYHEHDSLLENKSEETLSKEEIDAAWKEFEEEKNRPTVQQNFVGYPTYQRTPGAGPVTSNNIFGFRTDILLQLLNIKARRAYPGTTNISDIVPMLLKHLYETMEKNDTSFYQELLYIQQTEMAAPSQGSYLTPAGHIMPAYSGRGRPPLNPQHSTVHMQQQHLIQQAQNRLMNINNGSPRLQAPQVSPQVIEID